MREFAFIRQNKAKWLEIEQALTEFDAHPSDVWSAHYIQLLNDLAFSQSLYPKSRTTTYLNALTVQLHQKVYKLKQENRHAIRNFFADEVPRIAFTYRRQIGYSFLIFFISVLIGIISSSQDQAFVRLILGDSYVNMTLENIKKGDPVAVYQQGSNWGGFLAITINNLMVGMKCYISGILAGLGTGYILFQNSLMLGSFQYFFYEQGVLWESVRGIWIHGCMEIFGMVIESACGFILAASFLFPGTLPRLQSLKIGFKDSLKLFLSTMPFTIMAGILEGFITRYSKAMPLFLSVFLIITTLTLISFYYLVYPKWLHQKQVQL
ncbi:MAG: hypothetical protein CFE24_02035 [Flavobacterium sp. BFFFF2]|nr:MAG: hypothetical protein CFE24_02035 [Flavobacterium sp. BFFFF2]